MSCRLRHPRFNPHQKLPRHYPIHGSGGWVSRVYNARVGLKGPTLVSFLIIQIKKEEETKAEGTRGSHQITFWSRTGYATLFLSLFFFHATHSLFLVLLIQLLLFFFGWPFHIICPPMVHPPPSFCFKKTFLLTLFLGKYITIVRQEVFLLWYLVIGCYLQFCCQFLLSIEL